MNTRIEYLYIYNLCLRFFFHYYEIIQNAKSVNTIKNVVKIYLTNNTNLYYQIIQNNNNNSIDLYINEFSP